MKKISLVLVMAAVIFAFVIASPANEASAMPYTDVSKEVTDLYKAISELSDQGIVFGISATKFAPNSQATRGETAQMIVNALDWQDEAAPNPKFPDVPTNHKYYKAIAILADKKIINGRADGTFGPEGKLRRSHIAKIITLAFELEPASSTNTPFKDLGKIDATTKGYIAALVKSGVTQGTSATTFSPNKEMTRGQLARFIYRGLDHVDTGDFEIIGIE